jgi:outer membrane protein assembly factor BamB
MPGVSPKSKYCFIYLLLLIVLAAGAGPVYSFQAAQGPSTDPWEKPIAKCWALDTDFLPDVAPIVDKNGVLYLAQEDGALSAIDTANGKQLWRSGLGGEIKEFALTDSSRLAVLSEQEGEKKDSKSHFLQVLSSETGVTVWRKELELSGDAFLSFEKAIVSVVQRGDGNGAEFNLETGERKAVTGAWLAKTGEGVRRFVIGKDEGKPAQLSGDMTILTDPVGNITADQWKARVGGEVVDISLSDHGLVVSSADNFVYLLTTGHGDRKWKRRFTGRLLGRPVLKGNYGLFVTVGGNEAIVLNLTNGKVVNSVTLTTEGAFFTADAVGAGSGFALFTSHGISFYSPEGCGKK